MKLSFKDRIYPILTRRYAEQATSCLYCLTLLRLLTGGDKHLLPI